MHPLAFGRREAGAEATQAMSEEYLKERALKAGEGIVGLVAKEKKPVFISAVLEDKRYKERELARKEKLVSMLSVPMLVKKRVIGVLNIYTVKTYEASGADIDLLSTVANQAAVAIENTELMVKTKIIEEELETRKKVERAKGILMKKQGLNEDDAYKLMRKSSMDKRVTMKDIAEAIMLSHEISGER